ncbi:MAG: hypothetical protein RL009_608 [Actinomycetota bacterium]|jgi:hypothetical protein
MDKNKIKRGAVVAASAATILGLVFATPSFAATSKSVKAASSSSSSSSTTPAAPSFAGGDHKGKGHGKGHGKVNDANRPAPVSKTVTVDVPADGKTYKLVVTDTTVRPAPVGAPAGLPTPPKHTRVIDVTGTGSQTITIDNLRPGTYSVELVAVSSSQSLTVEAPVVSTTPAPTVTP